MSKRHVLFAVVLAGAGLPAFADTAPWPDTSGNTSPWKGTLSRSEVTAEFLKARAEGTLPPAGETYDDFSGVGPTAGHPLDFKRALPSLPHAMGAAPAPADRAASPDGDTPAK